MSTEFALIKEYFTRSTSSTDLSIGDDAALIQVKKGHQIAVSTDMSVVGIHFFQHAEPYDIGWKSLAVNISDMASMGANPKWATLSIALPEINKAWLASFSAGFFDCADTFQVDLIGGDTTRGSLNINVTIMGEVPTGKALTRAHAQTGDDIWVSGSLGHAALGLAFLQEKVKLSTDEQDICLRALHQPQPRVSLGLALQEIAHSCIDISDGLLADLGHLLTASSSQTAMKGATLQLDMIPCLASIKTRIHEPHVQQAILAGGDDYELCFTAAPNQRETLIVMADQLGLSLTRIGHINETGKIDVMLNDVHLTITQKGYDHFAKAT